jgi:hypothetical protein
MKGPCWCAFVVHKCLSKKVWDKEKVREEEERGGSWKVKKWGKGVMKEGESVRNGQTEKEKGR